MQQARIPNKKIKLVHHAILLLIELWRNSQQQHLLTQQIQLKIHTIILTPALATKKKNIPICSIYDDIFPSPFPINIFMSGRYKNIFKNYHTALSLFMNCSKIAVFPET